MSTQDDRVTRSNNAYGKEHRVTVSIRAEKKERLHCEANWRVAGDAFPEEVYPISLRDERVRSKLGLKMVL